MRIEIDNSKGPAVQIVAAGDMAFTGAVAESEGVFAEDVRELLHGKDVSCVNLECPLTTVNAPIAKDGPNLSAAPETVDILKQGGFDIAVMANNHIMDHGAGGMWETVEVCRAAGIETVGVGRDLSSSYAGVFRETNGIKTIFLAFAEEEFSCATETTPGAAKLELTAASAAIRKARQAADLVVVNVHGGNEYYPIPSPRMQKWYRFLVDCGASAVIGHHPHCVQGLEIYKDAPIFYSLGNFLFPARAKKPPCWYEGIIAKLIVSSDRVSAVEVFCCKQIESHGTIRIELMTEQEESSFNKKLDRLNEIAADTSLVDEFWKWFCSCRMKRYSNVLKMSTNGLKADFRDLVKSTVKTGDISHLPCIFSDFIDYMLQRKSTRDRRIAKLKSLLLCPAHHETLSTIVEMERTGAEPSDAVGAEFAELMRECE